MKTEKVWPGLGGYELSKPPPSLTIPAPDGTDGPSEPSRTPSFKASQTVSTEQSEGASLSSHIGLTSIGWDSALEPDLDSSS